MLRHHKMAGNRSLMFSMQLKKWFQPDQSISLVISQCMVSFQPMHGAAIQAAPIPTALICTVRMYISMVWNSHIELGKLKTVFFDFKFIKIRTHANIMCMDHAHSIGGEVLKWNRDRIYTSSIYLCGVLT